MSEELAPLSEREMELLRLLATGATNQQIAQELVISVNTVKVHLRNIYAKLGVASRTEANMVAIREGWVEVPRTDEALADAGSPIAPPAPVSPLPSPEQWMQVPLFKRVALAIAILVTLAALVLPLIFEGKASDEASDPVSGVFPTAPPGPPSTRWHTRAQMPTPRTDLAVVPHDGLIYAIGGVSNDGVTGRVEVYDPEADAWETASSKPTPAGFVSAVEVGDKIYVPGGIDAKQQALNVLEVYDPAEDAWQVLAPMPVPLGAYGLASLDDQIYLFGGLSGQAYVASVYRYDPAGDQWEALEPMEVPRGFLSAATTGNRIYVAGGYDDVNEFSELDAYDPATGDWTALEPMSVPRGGLVLVPVRDKLYAIGGGLDSHLAFSERYDPKVDAWSPFETPVQEQWRGLGAAFVGSNIYAIGGWNGRNLSVNEAYQALFQSLVPLAP